MLKSLELFDNAIKKGAEVFFMIEELNDPEESGRRHGVCKSNVCGLYNAKRDKCMHCKCFMEVKTTMLKHINIKARGRVEITHCPMAEWGRTLSEEAYQKEKEISNYYRELDGRILLK